ncbi:amiloride-sensitive sodium channel subunit delta isoform X1 [Pantherophis guttatus]|uniref:Amiloride-sensitive sodium channel subunit delta isoform X1 n=2 Tax=Pantherophis guttatus TaxID=94885 RepID=A0A6P9D485_PANGU|nr:amiloride-sensitive sodium channel subunit delta isoform X1 [Pantherophis guttatus]
MESKLKIYRMGEVLPKETKDETKEDDAALIEFYSSFKDLFEFFCLNTTIHGTIRLVCSNSNRMKTAFWALLFLSSFAMLYWQFALIFNQYWAYPVVMSMSVHSEPKMFPAITLCNLNPSRISPVNQDIAELDNLARETLYNLYGFHIPKSTPEDVSIDISGENPGQVNSTRFHLDRNIALVKMGGKVGFRLCNTTGGNCYNKVYISGVDAVQEWYRFHYMNIMSQIPSIIKMSQNDDRFKNLIYSCQYDGEPCRTSDHEHFHHPVYGSCFTLNKNGTDKFWKAFKPGIVYGLSLILKVEQKDHIPLLSTTAGVRVMIHRHNQTPFLEHEGFDIRPGTKSTIGIKQDEVSRLGGKYSQCTNNGEDVNIKLLYNGTYTLQACLHSCFQHHMVQKCGCGYYFYPLPPGAEYCNYNKHPAWGHCFYLLYKELTDHQLICFSQCPKLCKETWYKLSAGYANWPSTKSQKWIHRALQTDHRYNITTMKSKDIAKVNIFYEQLDYYSWDESPEYNVTLVMSNMGSQWSLWFGSSVLSVVEMFEFLVDVIILSLIFFYRRLTAKRRHKVSSPPKMPSVSLTLEKYRYIEEGLATDQDAEKSQTSYENPSFVHDEGLPPYSKYNKYQMPELYPPVVLHRFKHQEDQGTHQDHKS